MADKLIPVTDFKTGFTTCEGLKDNRLNHVQLKDEALGVHRESSRRTHQLVTPPPCRSTEYSPPSLAWEAFYPEGSINPKSEIPGGFGFYLSGPKFFSEQLQKGAKEVILSYRIMLADDWEWVKGGKLPGFCRFGSV